MAPTSNPFNSSNRINPTTITGAIKAGVSRLWEIRYPNNSDELIRTDMILIDEKGDYAYATLPHNSQFHALIIEGQIYHISNFTIAGNDSTIRLEASSTNTLNFDFNVPKNINDLINHLSGKDDNTAEKYGIRKKRLGSFTTRKSISSILNHCDLPYKNDIIYYCIAEVVHVKDDVPWFSYACPDCKANLTLESEKYYCDRMHCNKQIYNPTILYRLTLEVQDTSGSISLILFDEEVRDIMQQKAATLLKDQLSQGNSKDAVTTIEVPTKIRNTFQGKTFMFKVRVDMFNHNSSMSQAFIVTAIIPYEAKEITLQPKIESKTLEKRHREYIYDDKFASTNQAIDNKHFKA